jgi:hypothetical protein
VEREERGLDGEGEEEAEEHPPAGGGGELRALQRRPVQRVAAEHPQADHGREHEQPAHQRVDEELDRGVLAPGAAVGADEEVHRHQHDLEEDVEQEHVGGDEHPDHGGLQRQDQGEERRHRPLHPDAFGVVPGGQDHQRHQQRDQRHHHQRDAVDGEGEVDAPVGDPRVRLAQLEPVAAGVERGPGRQQQHEYAE